MPRMENEGADSLVKMASTSPTSITCYILGELLHRSNIEEVKVLPITTLDKPTWQDDIITYLLEGKLLEDKVEAYKLRCRVVAYKLPEDDRRAVV